MRQLVIKYRFRLYPHVVSTDKKELWQLEHFKRRRTCPTRKLTYNKDRKAFRINSQWISRKRLLSLKYEVNEIVELDSSMSDSILKDIINLLK
jgi:hypothetical protein